MKSEKTCRRGNRISEIIDFKRLEHESRKFLYLGFFFAILFHAVVGLFITYERITVKTAEQRIIKLRLIELPMTDPYFIKKPLQRKIYQRYRKKTVARLPETSKKESAKSSFNVEMPEDRYEVEIDEDSGKYALSVSEVLADSLLTEDETSRLPKDIIPLKNKILNDIGRYKAEIIIDPHNKKAIQGYTHIAIGWGEQLTPPDTLRASIRNLVRVINEHTNIHATRDKRVRLDSPELHQYPFIYITSDKSFTLTESEANSLGGFMRGGGFAIFDNGVPEFETGHIWRSFQKAIMDAGGPENYFWIRPISQSDQLYHCFFDFDNGAPPGTIPISHLPDNVPDVLLGIYLKRKLVGIYCPQGYGRSWGDQKNAAQLRMGVNLVVYALSQGKWFTSDYRMTAFDRNTRTFIEWFENGRVSFMANEYRGLKPTIWNPRHLGSKRIVRSNTNREIFVYNQKIDSLINRPETFLRFNDHGTTIIEWGDYNKYRGWYHDGRKMYDYDHDSRYFVEWDDFGMVIKQGRWTRN